MKLYNYWRSSASWRVRYALAHKGIAYEYVAVSLVKEGGEQHGDAYRALNPMRQVPTLEWVEGGEVMRLGQSLAIIEHLDATCPGPALLPAMPFVRAKVRQLAEIVNAGVQPLQNLEVMRFVREELKGDPVAWARHFVGRGVEALEAEAAHTASRYLVGDEVTMADCCLVPQLYACRRFGVDLGGCPTLLRVEANLQALDAYRASRPEAQPDAQP
ncbi:MAG: Maleylacetoacetate isomerase [Myxococcaceae bacterium]|nr:Maleylacetoacetate isomerase [Myxococcaceae bacterium]